jgi:hypothetical protein
MREKNISKAVRDTSDTSSDRRSVPSEETRPRVYWSLRPNRPSTSWELKDLINQFRGSRDPAVCIIENLEEHSDWLEAIRRELILGEDFLKTHTSRVLGIRERQPWSWVTPPDHQQLLDTDQDWRCIECFYSLPASPKTRISYYRHSRQMCKFICGFVSVDRLKRTRSVPGEPTARCFFTPTPPKRQQ